jgi:N-acetylglucosaminyl-diphospho-decaprenol L-rhamnosyltransferase
VSLVSVLIVNYKAYDELNACLRSLESDTSSREVETIVVDNASDMDALAPVSMQHPRVRFLPQAGNPGFASGVNEAARHAKGESFLLLNPDAVVSPGAVPAMWRFLAEHPRVAAVGARVYDPDGTVQRSARAFPTLATAFFGRTSALTALWPRNPLSRSQLVADETTQAPVCVDWVAGSCLMVRADAFRSVGGMDEGFFLYWEDADFCYRLRAAGWEVAYLPEASITHQVGGSSRHAQVRSIVAFHRSAYRYYRKHRLGLTRYVALPVAGAGLYARMAIKVIGACARRVDGRMSS